ncbi:hypothetical protein HK097_007542 [Rhizophlyctis rosea]|uniref:Ankyrin n=1 Tax=Rhizophlyctis rosea TaxID=64517 RepID=A0AAD5SEJ2_9FUNG|nr:hypothetical protein HK097_007542 [Rhizophlyctis rosea]
MNHEVCLLWATRCQYLSILKLLLPEASLYAKNRCVSEASKSGYYEGVELLVTKGADLHTTTGIKSYKQQRKNPDPDFERTNTLEPPLQIAAICGRPKIVQFLLDHNADIDVFHRSSLHCIIRHSMFRPVLDHYDEYMEIVVALVNAGIKGVERTLEAALRTKDVEFVRFLLERGADVHYEGGEFMEDATYSSPEVLRLLLDAGADVNALNGAALAGAVCRGSDYGKCKLIETYNEEERRKHIDGHANNTEIVRLLLESGANVDVLFGDAKALRKAFTVPLIPECTEVACLLLECGIDPRRVTVGHGIGARLEAELMEEFGEEESQERTEMDRLLLDHPGLWDMPVDSDESQDRNVD